MCFSAQASFTAAAALMPAGLYSMWRSVNVNKNYLAFAAIPLIFSVQQFCEGMVWHYYNLTYPFAMHAWAYAYLFFAYALWPFYVSLSVYLIESQRKRQRLMYAFVVAGALLGVGIYLPVILSIVPMNVDVIGNSVVYDTYQSAFFTRLYLLSYAVILFVPTMLSTEKRVPLFGCIVLIALLVTLVWYVYAFTSVWCFFAAILSIYIAYIVAHIARK